MTYEQMSFIDEQESGGGGITCISGGFPCQPHSVAGKRKASGDERDLWPEYRRITDELRPKWVVAENVRGLLSSEDVRFFRGILRDFANLGYDVGWCCYRAADVGAVHARARIGIIAYSNVFRCMETSPQINGVERKEQTQQVIAPGFNADPDGECMEGLRTGQIHRKQIFTSFESRRELEDWQRRSNLFEPKLLRNYHGLPDAVDRIKALGNVVVPQQFYPIYKAIADIEESIWRCNQNCNE